MNQAIFIRPPSYELFFQSTITLPDALRIVLSWPLAAMRDAHDANPPPTPTAWATAATSELTRLASLFDAGLLTRDEFERLKAQLLADS